MKFIKRGLPVLFLLWGQACTIPSSYYSKDQYCIRTADSFLAAPVGGQTYQSFTPFNGLDDGAWALAALPDGSLVVGGDFTHAGDIATRHVALWKHDTRTWEAIGEGLPDPVHELVSTPSGDLYALTRFEPASSDVIKIYRWKNPDWLPLPQLFAGTLPERQQVEAMVWDGQEGFFLGGNMSAAGGVAVNGLIHWDGQSWLPLLGDLPENGLFMVRALTLAPDGRLVAGGTLKTARDGLSERVMAWNGARWSLLGEALPFPVESLAAARDGRLSALVFIYDNNESWVNYSFSQATNQWIPDPQAFPLKDVQFKMIGIEYVGIVVKLLSLSPKELALWDGGLWQARANPLRLQVDPKRPMRFYVIGQKAYVVGEFNQVDGAAAENIAAWDGYSWSGLVPSGNPISGISGEVNSLVVDHHGNMIAGGDFQTAGDSQAANVALWDGTAWSPLAGGLNGVVYALAVDKQDRVYAGGNFSQASGEEVSGLARYDPATGTWESLGDYLSRDLNGVNALTIAADGTLYAAGFGSFQNQSGYIVSTWDGRQWKTLPGLFDREILTLLVDSQGHIFAGGGFNTVSGIAMARLVRWDALAGGWRNLGSGLETTQYDNRYIHKLLEGPDGSIIVSGYFNSVDGQPVCNIARLLPDANSGDGKWEELAGGLQWASSMAYGPDGSLYVATNVSRPDGESNWQLVVLQPSGTAWQLFGETIGNVRNLAALAVNPHGWLAVGGWFRQYGGQPVQNIAFLKVGGK
jgi:hypothetical protein